MSKENFTALLGAGTEYRGQLNFKGTVRIDGHFIGEIASEGKLILGKDAYVEGNVRVNELVVHGALSGEISVAVRTVLHQTAKIYATLCTPLLVMEEGALLQGALHMGQEEIKNNLEKKKNPLPCNDKKATCLPVEQVEQ